MSGFSRAFSLQREWTPDWNRPGAVFEKIRSCLLTITSLSCVSRVAPSEFVVDNDCWIQLEMKTL